MIKREKLYYSIISLFFKLLGLVPRSTGIVLADAIGHFWYLLDKRHSEITIENISYAFTGEMNKAQVRILAKRVFSHFVLFIFEMAWSLKIDLNDFHTYFTIKGFNNFKTAYNKNKGIIFLTGHIGVWELGTFFWGKAKIPGSTVYRPIRSPALNRFINDVRLRFGGRMFPVKKALAHIKEVLANRETIFLLMDQSTKSTRGCVVDFMKRKTFANKGIAMLAFQTRAPVIPLFVIREKSKYLIIIAPEIPLVTTGDTVKDIEINTQNYTTAIETVVRQYPDQYFWLHNRWKYQPDS